MSPTDTDGNIINVHLGHGVFGSCQKKYYKGIPVAVKVFNNLSSVADVQREASVMASCSHSSIPHVFGLNVKQKPYFVVSYFYGIGSSSCTLYHALRSQSLSLSSQCLGKVMLQLCQALRYFHSKQLLHCDIKSDNVILTKVNSDDHPMLIDFGKSIYISEAPLKRKSLTPVEQDEYQKKNRHIAPEIVHGHPPSFASDIFSFGVIMFYVSSKVEMKSCFLNGQKQCLEKDPKLRPSIMHLLSHLRTIN